MRSLVAILFGASSVALIASATRWLSNARGAEFPESYDGTRIYSLMWQWRAVGLAAFVFSLSLAIWSWLDLRHLDPAIAIFSSVFALLGLWIGDGSVITNEVGITKRFLGHSRTLLWRDIHELRLLKSRGEQAIELRTGSQKMRVDFRINAFQHLLHEIEDRTRTRAI